MALQWVMLGVVTMAEAVLAMLLCAPSPAPVRKRMISVVGTVLQPAFGVVPFALFQLFDIYLKNGQRLKCTSDACTVMERDRYERSLFKSQRNALLALGACLLYWSLYRICNYYKDIQKLENDVKRLKAN